MYSEDILDGWLSVPSMADILEEQTIVVPEHSPLANPTISHVDNVDTIAPVREGLESALEVCKQTPETPPEDITGTSSARKRRGHTKSRLGCTSCKRRKIKCQEQWPSCANCVKRGFTCLYPTVFQHAQHDRIVSEVMRSQSPRQIVRLPGTPKMYTTDDMRLFHHFIVAAYPCVPHMRADVWTKDIPAISHKYDYLMSSLLAVSASHLGLLSDGMQSNVALTHRQKAIVGLEEAFTRWPPAAEEVHVMLACSYLLGFQSSYMPDAFLDHLISLRGCSFLSQKILKSNLDGIFTVTSVINNSLLQFQLKNTLGINQALTRETLRSLAQLAPLMHGAHSIEQALFAQLVACVRPLVVHDSQYSPDAASTSEFSDTSTVQSHGSDSDSPYGLPDPLPRIPHPLFPAELLVTYEEVISEGFNAFGEAPPAHLQADPFRSFQGLMSSLHILTTWPQDQLLHLMSSDNKIGNLVMAHFNVVRFLIAPLTAPEGMTRIPIQAMVQWSESKLPRAKDDGDVKWTKYSDWPARVLRTMRLGIDRNRAFNFRDISEIIIKDPEAFLEGRLARL